MKSYKKWTAQERQKSLGFTNKAKRVGLIKQPTKCNRCGQTKGILHLHNEDYDYTLNILPLYLNGERELDDKAREEIANCVEPICWTCHMIHHSKFRNRMAHDRYFYQVYEEGFMPDPVYRHDFSILKKYGF